MPLRFVTKKPEPAPQECHVTLEQDGNVVHLMVDQWYVATLEEDGTLSLTGYHSSSPLSTDDAGRIITNGA